MKFSNPLLSENMPLVLKVPFDDTTHRIQVSTTTARRLAALPKEKHAPFVDGLMRMIRAAKPEEPAPLPKAKPRIRKPKLQKKAREVTEAIKEGTMPVDREAEPST